MTEPRTNQPYSQKRVLVTGVTGFVGQHLLPKLQNLGADVAVLTRKKTTILDKTQVFVGNIRDRVFVENTLEQWQPQVIFHLAGTRERNLSQDAFEQSIEVNVLGTMRLFFAGMRTGTLERVVMMGTGEEYGKNPPPFSEDMREAPVSAYSLSKQSATQLSQLMARSLGLSVCILRPSVAYGPGQNADMFLPALIQTLLKKEYFAMTMGEQTRDYIYVSDLVDAITLAGLAKMSDGEIINIASGQAVQIRDVAKLVENIIGVSDMIKFGALDYRVGEAMNYQLDITKAQNLLAWTAQTSMEDGLRRTINWYAKQ